mmetsp:Transcript_34882/g.115606  ORF Transcript_34882/g.115606 Transcript_34882/m.115606 type:complete len:327 (+) Transcript_34882:518-1498(+)
MRAPETAHTRGWTGTTLHSAASSTSSSATVGSSTDGGGSAGAEATSFRSRPISAGTFAREAADTARTRLCPAAAASLSSSCGAASATAGTSSLLSTMTWGLFARRGEKRRSSVLTASKSPSGSGRVPSTTCRSSLQRSMCRRKARPRPLPSCAPSSRPGMSARTSDASVSAAERQTPKLGVTVVKAYGAIFGLAFVAAARREDLPALGTPTKPTSASSLSSSLSQRCPPGSPCSASRGVVSRAVLKAAFPRPPRPPRATRMLSPCRSTSPTSASSSSCRTTVPGGTRTVTSPPDSPCRALPMPFWPPVARKWTSCLSMLSPSSQTR